MKNSPKKISLILNTIYILHMKIPFYHIDAFSKSVFSWNPACVIQLEEWLPDSILQKIAKENAVPETAFVTMNTDSKGILRWFTPEFEIDLCGHGTIATAHYLFTNDPSRNHTIDFETKSGTITVSKKDEFYSLEFPIRKAILSVLPEIIEKSLSIKPKEILKSRDYILVYEDEKSIKDIKIDRTLFDQINLDPGWLVVTARGTDCDFISRYFISQSVIQEDPVTGSSHCSLVPYWSTVLGKSKLHAKQLSERWGELFCEQKENHIIISGHATTYASGYIYL